VRAVVSLFVALVLGWSSIVDNDAVCHDDGTEKSGPCSNDGAPANVPCTSCPCKLPVTPAAPTAELDRPFCVRRETPVWPEQHLHAIENCAPPTPPPLA